jgi:hypothetical protein
MSVGAVQASTRGACCALRRTPRPAPTRASARLDGAGTKGRPPVRQRCGRGAQAHSAKSGEDLTAFEKFPEARTVDVTVVAPNKQLIGKTFKRDARAVQARGPRPVPDRARALALGAPGHAGRREGG